MNSNLMSILSEAGVINTPKAETAIVAKVNEVQAPKVNLSVAEMLQLKVDRLASKGKTLSDGKFKGSSANAEAVYNAVQLRWGDAEAEAYAQGLASGNPDNYTVRTATGWMKAGLKVTKGEKAFCRAVKGRRTAFFHHSQVTKGEKVNAETVSKAKAPKKVSRAKKSEIVVAETNSVEARMAKLEENMALILSALTK